MAEQHRELVITIGKTSGYTPEDPVDPRLAIEIAHCLSAGSNDFTVTLGEWYANCTTKIADDRIVVNIGQRTGYQGLEVPNDRTKTYICKDCGSILKHATTSQGKHVLVCPKCDPPSIVAMKDNTLKDNSASPMRDAPPVYSLKKVKDYGDATSKYAVEISKTSTLRGWIKKILSDTHEWGHIGIKSDEPGTFFGKPEVEYRYGNFTSNCDEMTPLLDKMVKSADYSGGYSRGDWLFVLED